MKPISDAAGSQMPALPMTAVVGVGVCSGGGTVVAAGGGDGERRTMTKSRVPFVGEASMEWRYCDVWCRSVCGAQDLFGRGGFFLIFLGGSSG